MPAPSPFPPGYHLIPQYLELCGKNNLLESLSLLRGPPWDIWGDLRRARVTQVNLELNGI